MSSTFIPPAIKKAQAEYTKEIEKAKKVNKKAKLKCKNKDCGCQNLTKNLSTKEWSFNPSDAVYMADIGGVSKYTYNLSNQSKSIEVLTMEKLRQAYSQAEEFDKSVLKARRMAKLTNITHAKKK